MLTIDARARLDSRPPFTDDELTELIAAVIDDLDGPIVDPSDSTNDQTPVSRSRSRSTPTIRG